MGRVALDREMLGVMSRAERFSPLIIHHFFCPGLCNL